MADALEAVAWKLIDVLPINAAKATLSQKAIALGVAIDKMRLLREKSTSAHRTVMSDDERFKRLEELAKLAESRAALAAPIESAVPDPLPPPAEA